MKIPLVDLKANYLSMKKDIDMGIKEVINKSAYIGGNILKDFETNYAKFCNIKYAVGCASGTSALHLALLSVGIKKGDEVITVPNTFIATTEAISYVGGKIKFVDVKYDTALMNIDELEKSISFKTKAIIVVHLFGQMPDMKRLRTIANDNEILLVEDASQSHGSKWDGYQAGYYGDIATYSFFPAKILGCYGDGGCVTTNNSIYAEKIRSLLNHGRKTKYVHDKIGFNYRLDTLQASILKAKLTKLQSKINIRKINAKYYNENINYNKFIEKSKADSPYYMYVIKAKNRLQFMEYMKKMGIGTSIHYPIPIHKQPAYIKFRSDNLPVAEKLAKEIVSIPVYPELTKKQLNYIVETINSF